MPPLDGLADEEIVLLPTDRLALAVLADAKARQTWNWRNWILEFGSERSLSDSSAPVMAIADAWSWLLSRGLVATSFNGSFDFHSFRISRQGELALKQGLPYLKAAIRLDVELLPVLELRIRPLFLLGEFEMAALAAMREVEIAVRTTASLGQETLGVDLMRQAFKPDGPLSRESMHKGESVAQMELFAGAIGMFKNPPSHRRVDYTDPTEASEVVLLADLLLRLLQRISSESASVQ